MYYHSDELYHFGILGMKWGVRRFQNPDGTLTAAGRRRLSRLSEKRGDAVSDYTKTNAKVRQKMANIESDIASYRAKADKWYVSEEKANKLYEDAEDLEFDLETLRYKIDAKKTAIAAANAKMSRFLARLPYDSVFYGKQLTDSMLEEIGLASLDPVYQTENGYNSQYYKKIQKAMS